MPRKGKGKPTEKLSSGKASRRPKARATGRGLILSDPPLAKASQPLVSDVRKRLDRYSGRARSGIKPAQVRMAHPPVLMPRRTSSGGTSSLWRLLDFVWLRHHRAQEARTPRPQAYTMGRTTLPPTSRGLVTDQDIIPQVRPSVEQTRAAINIAQPGKAAPKPSVEVSGATKDESRRSPAPIPPPTPGPRQGQRTSGVRPAQRERPVISKSPLARTTGKLPAEVPPNAEARPVKESGNASQAAGKVRARKTTHKSKPTPTGRKTLPNPQPKHKPGTPRADVARVETASNVARIDRPPETGNRPSLSRAKSQHTVKEQVRRQRPSEASFSERQTDKETPGQTEPLPLTQSKNPALPVTKPSLLRHILEKKSIVPRQSAKPAYGPQELTRPSLTPANEIPQAMPHPVPESGEPHTDMARLEAVEPLSGRSAFEQEPKRGLPQPIAEQPDRFVHEQGLTKPALTVQPTLVRNLKTSRLTSKPPLLPKTSVTPRIVSKRRFSPDNGPYATDAITTASGVAVTAHTFAAEDIRRVPGGQALERWTHPPVWRPEITPSDSAAEQPGPRTTPVPTVAGETSAPPTHATSPQSVGDQPEPPAYSRKSRLISPALPPAEFMEQTRTDVVQGTARTQALTRAPVIGSPIRIALRRPDMPVSTRKTPLRPGAFSPEQVKEPGQVEYPVPPAYAPPATRPETDVIGAFESVPGRFAPTSFGETAAGTPVNEVATDVTYRPFSPPRSSAQAAGRTGTPYNPVSQGFVPARERGPVPPYEIVRKQEPERWETTVFRSPVASPAGRQVSARQEESFLADIESGAYISRQPMPELPLAPKIQRAETPAPQAASKMQIEEQAKETPAQDIDAIARDVYAILKRRLARERERALGF